MVEETSADPVRAERDAEVPVDAPLGNLNCKRDSLCQQLPGTVL